ncbi:hypothetical protein HQ590_10560 [bacterium]|nr:hypothetical protein [bacterium]
MHRFWLVGVLVASTVAIGWPADGPAPVGIVDVAETGLPALELRVIRRTAVSAYRDEHSARGYVTPGRRVRLVRWTADWYYVAGETAADPVEGWVPAAAVEPPPAAWRSAVREHLVRAQQYRELIARHEVARGMTPAEVRASLGDPRRRVKVEGAGDADEEWVYVEDRYLPWYTRETGPDGEVAQSISYRKAPLRERRIRFRQGAVVAVGEPTPVTP